MHGVALAASAVVALILIAVATVLWHAQHTTTLEHVEWSYKTCHVLFDKLVICTHR